MGVEWGKIGQNNSHALRNLGSFPQTLSAVLGYTALGSEPAETKYCADDSGITKQIRREIVHRPRALEREVVLMNSPKSP